VYTVNRGNFGENCPKGRLITSMFGYLLPVTSKSTANHDRSNTVVKRKNSPPKSKHPLLMDEREDGG